MKKKTSEKPIMLITWDTETEGLYGDCYLAGYSADGENVKIVEPEQLMQEFISLSEFYEVHAYVHNASSFDLAVIFDKQRFTLDLSRCIIINNNIAIGKLLDYDVYIHDSIRLVPGSLDKISKSFGLGDEGKMNLEEVARKYGFKSVNEMYNHNNKDIPEFVEYFKRDITALYKIITIVWQESQLSLEEFVNCPTTPSLAMKIFKTRYPNDYKSITQRHYAKEVEAICRMAYKGARTEVFIPKGEGRLNHYDVNSLYPSVMLKYDYPCGQAIEVSVGGNCAQSIIDYMFKEMHKPNGKYSFGIFEADVYVPTDSILPFLAYRATDKLLFPVGWLHGVWTSVELIEAEKRGAEIHLISGVVWQERYNPFRGFINEMMEGKLNNSGAKKEVYKLMQNSLYGKFGMKRERKHYEIWTLEREKELRKKKIPFCITPVKALGVDVIEYLEDAKADYIHVELAAFITAYARITLSTAIEAMLKAGAKVFYCDTDSIVTDRELPADMVDAKEYGKWKLESVSDKAIFLQPKLYCENIIESEKGAYLNCKGKGIAGSILKGYTMADYEAMYEAAKKGDDYIALENQKRRQKFLTALRKGFDPNEAIIYGRTIHFNRGQKRTIDFENNCTIANVLGSERQFADEYEKDFMAIWGEFKKDPRGFLHARKVRREKARAKKAKKNKAKENKVAQNNYAQLTLC